MPFVHLHVHTQYSLLQGAIPVDSLFQKVSQLGMSAVAMTDTHNLFGAIDFYQSAKKAGIKPIIGCEIFYTSHFGGLKDPSQAGARMGGAASAAIRPRFHHLVLLCKNLLGYQNLCKMVTRSYTDAPPPQKGQASGPRALVHRDLLNEFGDGLIVLSGCLRGELPYLALNGETDSGIESLLWFKKRFGEDFFLELQDSPLPEQDHINEVLSQWGQQYGVQCVATTDCHYLEPKDAEAHEVLQCIEHGKNLDIDRPKSLVPAEYYLKSEQKMRERFERFQGACDNTQVISDRCNLEFKFKDEIGRPIYHLPKFYPDTGSAERDPNFDPVEFFKEESRRGLVSRFAEPAFVEKKNSLDAQQWEDFQKKYEARLEGELEMIAKTGFSGYFLIVADFINWAKRNGIPVGPGRGSGAGSIVAYSLKITDIDPIQFNLLFERFINPERISMPDFDVDFCQDRRGEVIDYVSKRYGSDNVCQIITFGKLQARAVIKDVGRVLGLSFAETDQLTKLLPDELDITLDRALQVEPRLREKMDADPKIALVMRYAQSLEGLYRNAGIHAAGVIITENPVVSYCPLFVGKDGDLVTQFDKDFAEAIGLVKFDFLGLKTLTVIDNAVKLVQKVGARNQSKDAEFTLEKVNYNDPSVFALISSGDTDGVFQVESSGMKDLCTRIQPNSLEDLTAINALYRPGPLGSGMVDDFIDRKHGRKQIEYDVEVLAPILKDTYGVILYQEQVMQIARELAGYSLGQADLLRRAMGKKKPEEMAKHREIFVKGAIEKGLNPEKAESIFDLMAKFAEYGFNKSHSAAYGVLTYQTAYLKTHYPTEFMAALMTTEMDNTEKITKYIGDARQHKIPVLPPDVNFSQKRFSVEMVESKKAMRFGLEAIKGVGGIAVDAILEARQQGPFKSVLDLCKRVLIRKLNKKVLESLCLAGALDSIGEVNRASLFASLEALLEHAGDEQAERELGQSSLFDSITSDEVKPFTPLTALYKQESEWPSSKKLAHEREVVGFFVSGHPMDAWQTICEQWLGWSTERLKSVAQKKAEEKAKARSSAPAPEGWGGDSFGGGYGGGRFRGPKTEVRVGGLLSEIKEITTKKGARMAFAQLEDLKGKLEVVWFPDVYATVQETLKRAIQEAEPVIVGGEVEFGEEIPKILGKSIEWATEAHRGKVQHVVLHLVPSEISPDQLRELKKQLLQSRGKCSVRIDFEDAQFRTRLELPKTYGVTVTPQVVQSINQIFGHQVVQLVSES